MSAIRLLHRTGHIITVPGINIEGTHIDFEHDFYCTWPGEIV